MGRGGTWEGGGTGDGAETLCSGMRFVTDEAQSQPWNLSPPHWQVKDWDGDATRRFFNWFYWSISVGAIFSLLVVAFVQQNISFLAGYLIPIACLALALLIFLLATPIFVTKPPTGSQVSAMIKLALKSCGCTRLGGTRPR